MTVLGTGTGNRSRSGRRDTRRNAEQPCPATGAHWLEGWVIFGNAYP